MKTRIMAHRSRGAAALALANHDELADLDPYVVFDPEPDGPPSALRGFVETCRHAEASQPLLVLQEDAIPCRGFASAVRGAWAALDGRCVLALYVGPLYRAVRQLRDAACQGRTLFEIGTREYTPTVAIVLPGALALEFAEWAPRNAPAGYRHDDEMLGVFCRDQGVRVAATIPCLAQHDNTLPSIAGHAAHGVRSAWCWPGEHDMSGVRWSL